jgi:GTPase-associated protein 1, N-terminal domain type 1
MADELGKSIRVHQALHGYADGHRLLVASTTLKPRDQKTMLIMSDVSGAGANIEDRGYLTGYPLADSGMYAVARTWAATEMARPGCVWTHTLLVDFSDLATLPAMSFLESCFLRPTSSFNIEDYSKSLFEDARSRDESLRDGVDSLERILAALYGFPKEKVVLALAEKDSSALVYAVWAQQWPRLRRAFRFCTSAFSDRSTEGAPFDLQFTPSQDRSYRSRFIDGIDANRITFPHFSWLQDAVRDIAMGNNGELRAFLKNVGGDVAGGRDMFIPLCTLHTMIPNFGLESESINSAISLIDNSFDSASAGSLRSLLVSEVARHPERLTEQSTEFLYKHLDLLSKDEFSHSADALGKAMWSFRPQQLLHFASEGSSLSVFAKATITKINKIALINALEDDETLMPELSTLRPDMLTDPRTWSIAGDWAYEVLRNSKNDDQGILNAILASGRSDLAAKALDKFGTINVLRAILNVADKDNFEKAQEKWAPWLDLSLQNPLVVADFLTTQSRITAWMLAAIAVRSHPDFVPNDVGSDPWATALSNIQGSLDEERQHHLSSYLLARAFGYRSKSQIELIQYSFDEVYFSAQHQRLSETAWQILNRSLPRSWFFDWDYCQRLRDAVTDMFLNRDLAAEGFSKITQDNVLFAELCRIASQNSRGRKYLKKVLRILRETGASESRIHIVEGVI